MGKYDWAEIQLFLDGMKGLEAIEKLTGESPTVILNKSARTKWEQTGKMTDRFYKLDIQERLYVTGMATRPPIRGEDNQEKEVKT